jgi:hypothetical protein
MGEASGLDGVEGRAVSGTPRSKPAAIAAALAVGSLIALLPAVRPAQADSPPAISGIEVDQDGHLIVKWTKESWQGSSGISWSTSNGRVDEIGWSYGDPLSDCRGPLTFDPSLGEFHVGDHCTKVDVGSAATETVTRRVFVPGVYWFQLTVAGTNHQSGAPCHYELRYPENECLDLHWSAVYKFTLLPARSVAPTPSVALTPARGTGLGEPSAAASASGAGQQEIVGPHQIDLQGGGRLAVAAGGRVIVNGAFNLHVTSGSAYLREHLVSFRCPAGYQPITDGKTLTSWIGARCRTITTPHAGVLVRGTEFSVAVAPGGTTFRVFEGALEVSDLGRHKVVVVAAGQTTTVLAGIGPADPTSFDPAVAERWWDEPPDWAVSAAIWALVFIYVVPSLVAISLRHRRKLAIIVVNLLTGWTLIGWVAALVMALAWGRAPLPSMQRVQVSPDGRWWWDGRAWQPMPSEPPGPVLIAPARDPDGGGPSASGS